MRRTLASAAAVSLLIVSLTLSCSRQAANNEHSGSSESNAEHDRRGGEHGGEHEGAHDREGGEHGSAGEGGEESGVQYAVTDTYDATRNGARLILRYDAARNAFVGTVHNTTTSTLSNVRVEVHLSNGTELGPTTPGDLAPDQKREVILPATTAPFRSWSAHAEVGNEEHRHAKDGG